MSADYRNRVVPPEVIAAGMNAHIRRVEQAQREEDEKNPPQRPPELDTPIVPHNPLVGILLQRAGEEIDAHFRRYGRLPDTTPEHDRDKR
jgi:hypothetical protein